MSTLSEPELTDPLSASALCDQFALMREQAGLIRGSTPEGSTVWYATRADQIRTVMGDPRFVTRVVPEPGAVDPFVAMLGLLGISDDLVRHITGMLAYSAGTEHRRLRRLASTAFTGRRVTEFRPRVQEMTDELLDRLATEDGPVDLVGGFAYPLTTGVICELVGVPTSNREQWREWGDALIAMDPARTPAALRGMVDFIRELISVRRDSPSDDLVTSLIGVETDERERLSEDEVVTLVVNLVFAGLETTAHLIGNSVAALIAHPDQLALLVGEPQRWPTAVNELARLYTPFPIAILRYATEDVALDGQVIHQGDAVQVVFASANSDPREHDDPGRFDVTRQHESGGPSHLSFGHGVHYCLGAMLAKVEVEVALRTLFSRFPELAAASAPEPAPGPLMIRLSRLPVLLRGNEAS
jgi:cytochrome P450